MPKIGKFQNLLALARACSCSACACSCLPVNGRARAQTWKSSFGSVSFPFINSLQKRWYLAQKAQHRKIWNCGIWGVGPEILFFESAIFLYKFFTKSVISDLKCQTSQNSKILLCFLVLACAQLVVASEPMRLDCVEKRNARNRLRSKSRLYLLYTRRKLCSSHSVI